MGLGRSVSNPQSNVVFGVNFTFFFFFFVDVKSHAQGSSSTVVEDVVGGGGGGGADVEEDARGVTVSVEYEKPAPSWKMLGGAPGIRRGVCVCADEEAISKTFLVASNGANVMESRSLLCGHRTCRSCESW